MPPASWIRAARSWAPLGVDVGDEDGGAFGGEAFGDGATNTGGCTGDNRSPAFESTSCSCHGSRSFQYESRSRGAARSPVLESTSFRCHGSQSFDMSHAVAGAGLRAALREDRVRPLLEGRGRRVSGLRTRWRYWPV